VKHAAAPAGKLASAPGKPAAHLNTAAPGVTELRQNQILRQVTPARLSSATLDGTDSPRYLALERHVSGLPQQLTVPNSVVRRCQTIRQFTPFGQESGQAGGLPAQARGAPEDPPNEVTPSPHDHETGPTANGRSTEKDQPPPTDWVGESHKCPVVTGHRVDQWSQPGGVSRFDGSPRG